ncbi:UPF0402 protein [Heterocephalus glaber]|uniref:UPF0402 protein n=1 Tax=Heterocephalus glaber TaxID=10181 RepID=G5C5C2_HETGA|nr:UPF0402 protein [Heterocephalus glaber]
MRDVVFTPQWDMAACGPPGLTDKFTESVYVLANEPSVALYRLQEHVRRSLPELAQHKADMQRWEEQSQGAIYTVEYACSAVKNLVDSSVYFRSVEGLLKQAINIRDHMNASAQGHSQRPEASDFTLTKPRVLFQPRGATPALLGLIQKETGTLASLPRVLAASFPEMSLGALLSDLPGPGPVHLSSAMTSALSCAAREEAKAHALEGVAAAGRTPGATGSRAQTVVAVVRARASQEEQPPAVPSTHSWGLAPGVCGSGAICMGDKYTRTRAHRLTPRAPSHLGGRPVLGGCICMEYSG